MLYTKDVIYETDFAQIKYLCHPIISYAHRHKFVFANITTVHYETSNL